MRHPGTAASRFDRRHEHDPMNWTSRFRDMARRTPERLAVDASSEMLTYRQLDDKSERIAGHLQGLDLTAGDVVATRFERTDPLGVCWSVGVLKAGLCLYQLEPTLDTGILCRRLASAGKALRLVISDDDAFSEAVRERVAGVEVLSAFLPAPAHEGRSPNPVAADAAILVQSSGTTGQPKVIRIPYRNLTDLAEAAGEHMLVESGCVHMQLARRTFDAAAFELIVTLGNGGTLLLVPEAALLDARVFAEHVVDRGVTNIVMTPTHIGSLAAQLSDDGKRRLLGGLRCLALVGEVCPDSLLEDLTRFMPGRISNSYGPSEAGIMATSAVMWDGRRRVADHLGDVIQGSAVCVGVPGAAGVEVHAVDGGCQVEGTALIANGLTDVYTDDALNRKRYLTAPDPVSGEATVFFDTGDLVRVRHGVAGPQLEFVGRADNQVKIAGQLVVTDEVQLALERISTSALSRQQGTPRYHVAAEKDPATERLSLVCTFTAPSRAAATELAVHLAAEARRSLEPYKVPSSFRWVPEFPAMTGSKLDARKLAEISRPVVLRDARKADPTLSGADPTQSRLLWLATAAAEYVSEGITLDDRVTDIVGDSLGVMAFQATLQDEFDGTLDVGELPNMTLREVASALAAPGASGQAPILSRLQRGTAGGPPLFLAPPGDGSPQVYMPLVKALGPECDVYGFRCLGSDPGEPLESRTIEQYASEWVDLLVERQPEGPVHLAGFCFGGVVVYEMARQLQERGRQVALVAMFDSPDPGQQVPVADNADLYSSIFHSMFGVTVPADRLRRHGDDPGPMLEELVAFGHAEGKLPVSLDVRRVQRIIDIERATGELVPDYIAPPLDIDLLFFLGDPSPLLRWAPHPCRTWAQLVASLTVVPSQGDHLRMMKAENVDGIAGELRRHLGRAAPEIPAAALAA